MAILIVQDVGFEFRQMRRRQSHAWLVMALVNESCGSQLVL